MALPLHRPIRMLVEALTNENLMSILRHTTDEEQPSARQQNRYDFALVSKRWSETVHNEFQTLDVFGTDGMVKATARLSNPTDRAKVKKVYLQLASPRGQDKGTKFLTFMQRVKRTEEFEFSVSAWNFDVLEKWLVGGLGALTRVREIKIGVCKKNPTPLPLLDSSILGVIAANWRQVRIVSLNLRIAWPNSRGSEGVFRSLRHLHTIELSTNDTDCHHLFDKPPDSLRTVILAHPDMYIQDTIPLDLYHALASSATNGPNITLDDSKPEVANVAELILRDPVGGGNECPVRHRDKSGEFLSFLSQVPNLRRLTCAPCAVDGLFMLATLPGLRELVIVEDRARLEPALAAIELRDLLSQGTLARVSIGASIRRNWSGFEQVQVDSVAMSQNIELVWL